MPAPPPPGLYPSPPGPLDTGLTQACSQTPPYPAAHPPGCRLTSATGSTTWRTCQGRLRKLKAQAILFDSGSPAGAWTLGGGCCKGGKLEAACLVSLW